MAIHRNDCENEELNTGGRNDDGDDDEGEREGEIKVTRAGSVVVGGSALYMIMQPTGLTPFFVGAKWQSEKGKNEREGKEERRGKAMGRGEMSSGSFGDEESCGLRG